MEIRIDQPQGIPDDIQKKLSSLNELFSSKEFLDEILKNSEVHKIAYDLNSICESHRS